MHKKCNVNMDRGNLQCAWGALEGNLSTSSRWRYVLTCPSSSCPSGQPIASNHGFRRTKVKDTHEWLLASRGAFQPNRSRAAASHCPFPGARNMNAVDQIWVLMAGCITLSHLTAQSVFLFLNRHNLNKGRQMDCGGCRDANGTDPFEWSQVDPAFSICKT